MSNTNAGGPAFSTDHGMEGGLWRGSPGMTLRDYFAAKAMQTLLGSEYTSEHGLHEGWMGALAHESYMVADAMMKARQS